MARCPSMRGTHLYLPSPQLSLQQPCKHRAESQALWGAPRGPSRLHQHQGGPLASCPPSEAHEQSLLSKRPTGSLPVSNSLGGLEQASLYQPWHIAGTISLWAPFLTRSQRPDLSSFDNLAPERAEGSSSSYANWSSTLLIGMKTGDYS